MSRWVITDIHGCFNTFKYLLEEKVKLTKHDHLYLLGDYINKGPFSREVLDYLIELKQTHPNVHMARGNHEQDFLKLSRGELSLEEFYDKGGQTLLRSFGINQPLELAPRYITFMNNLEWFFALPDFYLVHAGFDFSQPNPFSEKEEILSIRDYSVDFSKSNDRPVLHGHTPTDIEQIIRALQSPQPEHLSLDAGCAYRSNPKQASLIALNLDNWSWKIQENIDSSENYSE